MFGRFLTVTVERLTPAHPVQRVMLERHPVTGRRRQVGICGLKWEDGWSPITGHQLTTRQLKDVGDKLRKVLDGSQQSGHSRQA